MSGPKHVSVYLRQYIDRMERKHEEREVVEPTQGPQSDKKTSAEHRAELPERFGIKR